MLADVTPGTLPAALEDAASILAKCVTVVTGNPILFAIFGCSVLVAGFKVFKRAKNSVK